MTHEAEGYRGRTISAPESNNTWGRCRGRTIFASESNDTLGRTAGYREGIRCGRCGVGRENKFAVCSRQWKISISENWCELAAGLEWAVGSIQSADCYTNPLGLCLF